MMFCPRVHPRAADVRGLLRSQWLDVSRDVAALSGGSAQVVSALCLLLLMAVSPEMQLEMGWQRPWCLGPAAFPAHLSKQVVWYTLRAAMSELFPSLSGRTREQFSMWFSLFSESTSLYLNITAKLTSSIKSFPELEIIAKTLIWRECSQESSSCN